MNKVLNDSELEEQVPKRLFHSEPFKPRKTNGSSTRNAGKKILEEMNDLPGSNDSFYLDNVDKVYSEVNRCGILVFNKFIDALNNNRLELFDLLRCDLNGPKSLFGFVDRFERNRSTHKSYNNREFTRNQRY